MYHPSKLSALNNHHGYKQIRRGNQREKVRSRYPKMDHLSPFQFDQIDDLFPLSPLQEHTIQQDLNSPSLRDKTIVAKSDNKRKSSNSLVSEEKIENPSDNRNKKVIHREVERLRRQEMAALTCSLKSLIPPEHLKGKKSLSDHMQVTVNYIIHMQKEIAELSKKKDELKRSFNKLTIYVGSKCLPSNFDGTEAAYKISREDIQIVLSTSLNSEVALSILLNLLIQEGLHVISSTSTKLNRRLVHTIQSKVSDESSINPYELQKKLRFLVPNVYA